MGDYWVQHCRVPWQNQSVFSMEFVYLPLIFYLIIVFAVPFFLKKEPITDESYFLAGRKLGVASSLLSVVATETSVATVLIFPAAGYAGRWNLLALCLGYIAGRILVARFYLKAIYEMTDTSIYKAVGADNGSRGLLEIAYLLAKYISSGVRFFMGGLALAELFGGPVALWILLTAMVAGVYSLTGGLKAVVVTDQLQGMILFLMGMGFLVLLWPGLDYWHHTAGPALFSWTFDLKDGAHTIPLFLGGLVVSIGSHGADQDLLQRVLAVRNLKLARRSLILSGPGATIVIMTFIAVGAFLFAADPNLGERGQLVTFVKQSANPVLSGLFAVLVAAASMSTLDSAIHSTGAVWKSLLQSKKSGRWFSLISLVALTLSALSFTYFAQKADNLLALALGSMNYVNGGLIGI
ncbi:MAG: hypothetical protein KDK25_15535, partial [Leptospiraceae bacterium]|nr:hypothetical protein [Leptospiraceae bacterium]